MRTRKVRTEFKLARGEFSPSSNSLTISSSSSASQSVPINSVCTEGCDDGRSAPGRPIAEAALMAFLLLPLPRRGGSYELQRAAGSSPVTCTCWFNVEFSKATTPVESATYPAAVPSSPRRSLTAFPFSRQREGVLRGGFHLRAAQVLGARFTVDDRFLVLHTRERSEM